MKDNNEEYENRKKLNSMYKITITTLIIYILIIVYVVNNLEEGHLLNIIIAGSTTIMVIICFYGFKLEVDAGYYECNHCHHRYKPQNYFIPLISPHINTTRYMKCPKCGKRSWSKKVMTKE